MLEEELEDPPEGDGAIVKLIQQKIAKVIEQFFLNLFKARK